ncbi:MAG TPA: DUF559 domain-containing protein [Caulobacteraceae bacterium]|nr:DUF559 domain-containing protein [Caulobacteraceae bacterium]
MDTLEDRAIRRARDLRRVSTPAEKALWRLLRDRRLSGLKFRRQAPIGSYVADFACLSARLVLEADGGVHRLRVEADTERDAWLRSQGFRVLRFSNEVILSRPDLVIAAILSSPLREKAPFETRTDEF